MLCVQMHSITANKTVFCKSSANIYAAVTFKRRAHNSNPSFVIDFVFEEAMRDVCWNWRVIINQGEGAIWIANQFRGWTSFENLWIKQNLYNSHKCWWIFNYIVASTRRDGTLKLNTRYKLFIQAPLSWLKLEAV